jgi:hypothetical protein
MSEQPANRLQAIFSEFAERYAVQVPAALDEAVKATLGDKKVDQAEVKEKRKDKKKRNGQDGDVRVGELICNSYINDSCICSEPVICAQV